MKNLDIPRLHRINLIGGYNGTGKSTLLEGIFFFLDRRGPIALTRPFMWRNLGMNGKESLDQLFYGLNSKNKIEISSLTSDGKFDITMSFGNMPRGITMHIPQTPNADPPKTQQSLSNEIGLDIKVKLNGRDDDGCFALPMPDGISINNYRVGSSRIPVGSIVSPATRNTPQDNATRFTTIVKQKRLQELLEVLAIVRPSVSSIQLLQEGANSVLFAQMKDGSLLPFPMLGDGVQTVLSIAMAIMSLSNGVLLLDEFDSTIHYSILSDVWKNIAILADRYSCQIFAVTHSRECINAALDGAKQASRQKDLQYIRLESNASGNSAVCYNSEDLKDSMAADWEIR